MTDKEKQLFKKLEELTLILMWLTRWKEKIINDEFIFKAWKGYDFKILNSLLDKQYLSFSYKSKSAMFLEKGIQKAKELVKKYHFESLDY